LAGGPSLILQPVVSLGPQWSPIWHHAFRICLHILRPDATVRLARNPTPNSSAAEASAHQQAKLAPPFHLVTLAVGTFRPARGDTARSDRGKQRRLAASPNGLPHHAARPFRLPRCQTCCVWKRRTRGACPMPGILKTWERWGVQIPCCKEGLQLPRHASVWILPPWRSSVGRPLFLSWAAETGSISLLLSQLNRGPQCGVFWRYCAPRG
jgi:hypothetical protein